MKDKSSKMSVSVIIPTLSRDANLHGTILMLFAQERIPDEIVVVDQTPAGGHDRATNQFLTETSKAGKIKWILLETASVTLARNVGVEHSTSDILLFVDDDIIIGHDFIERHLDCYKDCAVQIVTGLVHHGTELGLDTVPEQIDMTPLGFLKSSNSYIGRLTPFNRVSGGNFSCRKEVVAQVGGFDENLAGAAHGEDIDFALRCIKVQIPIHYDSRPWIYHLASPRGGGRADVNGQEGAWLFCRLYLAFRHMEGKQLNWFVNRFLFRRYVLNKTSIKKPWLIPRRLIGFFVHKRQAILLSKKGLLNSVN